jgi:two-component SAPR family response regulator
MVKQKETDHGNAEVNILLVDDDADTVEVLLEYIRKRFGRESQGVRSRERAVYLIDKEDYRPDLVIHDCKPLNYESDVIDSEKAGNELYAFFIDEDLSVAVLSGASWDEMSYKEPYRSDPPLIWLEKPLKRETLPDGTSRWVQIDEAVEAYLESKG